MGGSSTKGMATGMAPKACLASTRFAGMAATSNKMSSLHSTLPSPTVLMSSAFASRVWQCPTTSMSSPSVLSEPLRLVSSCLALRQMAAQQLYHRKLLKGKRDWWSGVGVGEGNRETPHVTNLIPTIQ